MKDFPTQEQILDFIRAHPNASGKREIGRAFGIKGNARIELKRVLREMTEAGLIEKGRKKFHKAGELPPVAVLRVMAPDSDGDLWAEPLQWDSEDAKPRVSIPPGRGEKAVGEGDQVLVKIDRGDHGYFGKVIRKVGSGPQKVLGIFRQQEYGGRIVPVSKKADREWVVQPGDRNGARDGELVEGEIGRAHV